MLLLVAMRGYGRVPRIEIAMSGDPVLTWAVASLMYRDWTTPGDVYREAEAIVLRWTGADAVDPSGRGPHIDGRRLAALEAFADEVFVQRRVNRTDPLWAAAQLLDNNFDHIAAQVATRLALMGPATELIEGLRYHPVEDRIFVTNEFDLERVLAALEAATENLSAEPAARAQALRPLLQVLAGVGKGAEMDQATLVDRVDEWLEGLGLAVSLADVEVPIARTASAAAGSDGDALVVGSSGADLMVPGPGDDRPEGGRGGDVYLMGVDYGRNVVIDEGHPNDAADTIRFVPPASPGRVRVGRSADRPDDLELILAGGRDRMIVERHFASPDTRIERFEFADGTVWTWRDVRDHVGR